MSAHHRYEFRSVVAGVETLRHGGSMPCHHHNEGYATIVLAGSVTEVSFAGGMYAEAGDDRVQSWGKGQLPRLEQRLIEGGAQLSI